MGVRGEVLPRHHASRQVPGNLLAAPCWSSRKHSQEIDKIKPLLDILLPTFQNLYHPSRNLSIDETIVGFRGRFGSIQYMPQKPTKWGIKAFLLADAANGYLLNCLVYTGAQTLEFADASYESLPIPAQVAMNLMGQWYLGKGYHLFTDR